MEEQPQESPTGQPTEAADESPKILKNLNSWIAGATGLVIALGGLVTAYKQITDNPAEQAVAATLAETAAEAAAPADTAAADEALPPILYEGELDDGSAVKLEFDNGDWTLTAGKDEWVYEDQTSMDETRVFARLKDATSYLRWPVKGGMAEESDDKRSWTDYAEVYPPEPPAAE